MVDLSKARELAASHYAKLEEDSKRQTEQDKESHDRKRSRFAEMLNAWGIQVTPEDILFNESTKTFFVELGNGMTLTEGGRYTVYTYYVRIELGDGYCDSQGQKTYSVGFSEPRDETIAAYQLLTAIEKVNQWLDTCKLIGEWGFDTWDDEEYRWFKAKPATTKEPLYRVISTSDAWGVAYHLEQLGNAYEVVQFSTCYGRDDDGIQRMFFTAICKRID